jgi:hypothetical protein
MSKRLFLKAVAALTFAAIALPSFADADASAPPDGSVSIVYYRPDGDYNKWGVHGWISPTGGNGTPIDEVDWFNPVKPKGKLDDGSIYFHIPLAAFGSSGVVNYIIHKGDKKEQGGGNQHFDGNTTKQIWVNSGDVKIYTSKEEAVKARTAQ